MSPRKKEETKSFEENMKRLEEIVSALERGDAALADSLALFEEGTQLPLKFHSLHLFRSFKGLLDRRAIGALHELHHLLGMPTSHKKFGECTAILAGDAKASPRFVA